MSRSACHALHCFHVTSNTLWMLRSALFPLDFLTRSACYPLRCFHVTSNTLWMLRSALFALVGITLATTAKACGWDVCVVAGWVYSKCTQGRLTLCGIWLKKLCLEICRQKRGRTKMSCCTCVAGNGVMSAIMATCCRRQLPNWWIAEPTMGVKKTHRIHVWCTWYLQGFVKIQ